MKLISWLMLIACGQQSCAQQQDTEPINKSMEQLAEAMINKDAILLDELLAAELVYGHSNGNVQDKQEFMAEIESGLPVSYLSIDREDETVQISGDIAVVRHIFAAKTSTAEGGDGNLRIGNVLVWHKERGSWKLLVRQAYRL